MKTTVRDGLTLMRPWHACKNLLIFLPLFFHGGIFSAPEKMAAAAIGFAAFSLSASAIYALNDCRDAPQDRQHPRKKNRPVAAGRISERAALTMALALAALNPDIAMVVTGVPSFCDLGAGVAGRAPGGPQLLRSAQPGRWVRIIPATSYCDTANFARRVHCPTTVIVGWVDVASVPASVYAAYNNLPGKMKRIIDMPTMGHGNPPEYTAAIAEMVEKLHR